MTESRCHPGRTRAALRRWRWHVQCSPRGVSLRIELVCVLLVGGCYASHGRDPGTAHDGGRPPSLDAPAADAFVAPEFLPPGMFEPPEHHTIREGSGGARLIELPVGAAWVGGRLRIAATTEGRGATTRFHSLSPSLDDDLVFEREGAAAAVGWATDGSIGVAVPVLHAPFSGRPPELHFETVDAATGLLRSERVRVAGWPLPFDVASHRGGWNVLHQEADSPRARVSILSSGGIERDHTLLGDFNVPSWGGAIASDEEVGALAYALSEGAIAVLPLDAGTIAPPISGLALAVDLALAPDGTYLLVASLAGLENRLATWHLDAALEVMEEGEPIPIPDANTDVYATRTPDGWLLGWHEPTPGARFSYDLHVAHLAPDGALLGRQLVAAHLQGIHADLTFGGDSAYVAYADERSELTVARLRFRP